MADPNIEKIEKIRAEKEAAIKAGNFEKAARLRDEEKRLSDMIGIVIQKPVEISMNKKEAIKNILVVSLLLCLICIWPLYLLFVKKVMWCNWIGYVETSSHDPLFWLYAAALVTPVPIFIYMIYSSYHRKG